jgi:thiol:disulfide interchange protein
MSAGLIGLVSALLVALAAFILGRRGANTTPGLAPIAKDAATALAKAATEGAAAKVRAAQLEAASKQQAAEDAARKSAQNAATVTSLSDYLNSRRGKIR